MPHSPSAPPTDAAELRGLPSSVWRFGQDRRFELLRALVDLSSGVALDLGCGLGVYTARMAGDGAWAMGTEIEWPRAVEARGRGIDVVAAVGEHLPLGDGLVRTVLLHEVLEHVADDRATVREAVRVLEVGGRVIIFVPNRWWPFETHGVKWGSTYRFGNIPLVNYLPDAVRNRLAPHVRVYTRRSLRALFEGVGGGEGIDGVVVVTHHGCIFPGYDNLTARRPMLGRLARALTYGLERTPLRWFGLSHVLVVEKRAVSSMSERSVSERSGASI
ncbi:MAG: class I SAM-dependent methyltransferase [Ardenticatenales bacterium]